MILFQCGCGNWLNQGCGGCTTDTPALPGYNLTPYYYCQEYANGWSNNNPPNNNGNPGGTTIPDVPEDLSIAAMIKPEECSERIVGDLNRDCMLSPYEMCLLKR